MPRKNRVLFRSTSLATKLRTRKNVESSNRKTIFTRFWEALNRPVSLLLISTVLVGGAGKIYTDYTDSIAAKKAELQEEKDIMLELKLRETEIEQVVTEDTNRDLKVQFDRLGELENCRQGRMRAVVDIDDPKFIDLTLPPDRINRIRSVVYGAPPYSPSVQKFSNVHIAGLIWRIDQIYGDKLGDHRLIKFDQYLHKKPIYDSNENTVSDLLRIPHLEDGCFVEEVLSAFDAYLDARAPGIQCIEGPMDSRYCSASATSNAPDPAAAAAFFLP